MPELFCGFSRDHSAGPTPYPVAYTPQAWAASAIFLSLQVWLELGINATEPCIWFHRPQLPSFVGWIAITNLRVASASVDLQLTPHDQDIRLKILRRQDTVDILIAK
jgi:glycogen debranching enzyme